MSSNKKDIKVKRKVNANNKNNSIVKILGLSALLLLVILAAAFSISKSAVKIVSPDTLKSSGTGNGAGNCFYSANSDSIKDMGAFSSGIAILSDTSLTYLDASGNEIETNIHKYSNPCMEINNKTVLVYDRGNYSFRVEKNCAVYNEFTFTSKIICAAVGNKGNYAYVLNSDAGYQSHLFVYSYRGIKQFEWGSSSDYITDIALSDNGKYVVCAQVGVDNAEYYTDILFFNFDYSEVIYTVRLEDTTVYDIDFVSRKNVIAYTDSGVYLIEGDSSVSELSTYSSAETGHFSCCHTGLCANVIFSYGNANSPVLYAYDKKGRALFQREYQNTVSGVCSSEHYIAVVNNDSIEVLNTENTPVGEIKLDEKCLRAVIADRHLYVMTVSGIYSFSVNSVSQDAVTDNTEAGVTEETSADSAETSGTSENNSGDAAGQ